MKMSNSSKVNVEIIRECMVMSRTPAINYSLWQRGEKGGKRRAEPVHPDMALGRNICVCVYVCGVRLASVQKVSGEQGEEESAIL